MLGINAGKQKNNSQIQTNRKGRCSFSLLNNSAHIYKKCLFLMIVFLLFDKVQGKCLSWGPNNQCSFCDYKCGPIVDGYQTVQHGTCSYLGEDLTNFQCLDKCCDFVDEDVYNDESNNRTTNCQPNACESYKGQLFEAIYLPIFFFFTLVVLPICICICICIYCHVVLKRSKVDANPDNNLPNLSNSNANSATNFISEQIKENDLPLFIEDNNESLVLKLEQVCTICLQNHTEIMTNCGHYFHIDCIGKWIDKNSKCPICNGNQQSFNPLIVYCKKCHYRTLGVKVDSKKGSVYQLMEKYKQTICSACKQ